MSENTKRGRLLICNTEKKERRFRGKLRKRTNMEMRILNIPLKKISYRKLMPIYPDIYLMKATRMTGKKSPETKLVKMVNTMRMHPDPMMRVGFTKINRV